MNYYTYQKIPEPFLQIKILKILSVLCKNNRELSNQIYDVLKLTLTRADNINTDASHAVVHQCILTITSVFPNKELLELASKTISKFLKNSNKQNLIYLGMI